MKMKQRLLNTSRLLISLFLVKITTAYLPVEFKTESAKDASNLVDLNFVSRIILPYGPDLFFSDPPQPANEHPWRGFGFGMGAAEEMGYDYVNHFAYAAGEYGYIKVVDFSDPTQLKLTDYSFALTEHGENIDMENIKVCSEKGLVMFLAVDMEKVLLYKTVSRDNPTTPTLFKALDVGSGASTILPNKDCTLLAIAKENEGKGLSRGSVTIIRNIDTPEPNYSFIPIDVDDTWDDEYMLRKGLHMPLTLKALEYWDDHSPLADELDFTEVRNNYNPAIFLEPQFLAWADPQETELLMNLQDNNGLLRIDVENNVARAVASYGLKDHSEIPVDINSVDGSCNLRTYHNLFALRNVDVIVSVRYNDKTYVVTANEGSDKDYEGWEEKMDAKDLFDGSEFTLPKFTIDKRVFDPENATVGDTTLFNSACEGDDCVGSAEISLGSTAIDYESDPTNPLFYRMVLFGGRGWSIYELPDNPELLLKQVFDSGDYIEKTGCDKYPWAHNAVQDDDFAPASNFPNNTLYLSMEDEEDREGLEEMNDPEEDGCEDQGDGTPGACPMKETVDEASSAEGPQVERVAVGVACGRLVAVCVTEKNSIAFLFDITNVGSPDLKKVFHLSPASENKSAGLAYNDGTLGELDAEQFTILSADQSPTGNAAVVFAGAYSGSLSFWGFQCAEKENTEKTEEKGKEQSSSGSRTAALAATIVSCVLLVATQLHSGTTLVAFV